MQIMTESAEMKPLFTPEELAEKVDDVQAERILYGTSDAPPVGILKKEDANENPNLL